MAIRKINSRSIQDGQIATADLADDAITAGKIADSVTLGVGFFQGENGNRGDSTSGKGAILICIFTSQSWSDFNKRQ